MSAELFGVWRLGSDGRTHYFLGGRALCRGRVRDTGRPLPLKPNKYPDTRRDCPGCRKGNLRRWADPRPTGVAKRPAPG